MMITKYQVQRKVCKYKELLEGGNLMNMMQLINDKFSHVLPIFIHDEVKQIFQEIYVLYSCMTFASFISTYTVFVKFCQNQILT